MNPPRLLITAGPTQEPIDEVRFIANRSSGRMGIALAAAASELSLGCTLLLGPIEASSTLPDYSRFDPIRFQTAAELQGLLRHLWGTHDILIMAAAVADFRPVNPADGKLRRGDAPLNLQLEPVPDLLAECAAAARPDQLLVGFALEPNADLPARAAEKLMRKGIDLVVANPIETMGSQSITAMLISADGSGPREPAAMSKVSFAGWLIRQCVAMWNGKSDRSTSLEHAIGP